MGNRNPVRFLAPLALIAAFAAVVVVVQSAAKDSSGSAQTTATVRRADDRPVRRRARRRVYVVKAGDNLSLIAERTGVPLATLVVPLTGLIAFVGGVMVLVGYRARFGAFLLFCFLVPVTLAMHDFWSVSDPAAAAQQKAHFMKNLSLIGGTLLLMYFGSGPLSLDD